MGRIDCGSCAESCPCKAKTWSCARSGSTPIRQLVIIPSPPEKDDTRRRYRSDSRFRRLLPEFSAACAGCGKRPVQRTGAVAVRHGRTVCSRTTRSSASACCFLCDSSGRRCAQRSSICMTDCHEPATSAARGWLNLFGVYEGSEEASENLKEKLEDSRRAMPCATFSLVPIIRSNPISGCSTTTDGPRHQLRGTAPRAGNLEDQRVVVNTAAYCNIGGQSSKAVPLGVGSAGRFEQEKHRRLPARCSWHAAKRTWRRSPWGRRSF